MNKEEIERQREEQEMCDYIKRVERQEDPTKRDTGEANQTS